MRCKLYQWTIENELDSAGSVQKPRVLAHLEKCPACRRHHDQLVQLGRQLTAQPAVVLDHNRIGSLQARISHQLDQSMTQHHRRRYQEPSPRRLYYKMTAMAAGVVLAVLAGLMMNLSERQTVQDDPIAFVRLQSQQFKVEFAVLTYLSQHPIQAEIQKLETDTMNALNFLKEFAPSSPVELASIGNENSSEETVQ
ncbi:MAG: hypothetical protein ACYTET_06185 [Planctomycetota bacterium]|jgi:predicted anti-sigma-YlaC factor YlaD